MCSAKRAYNKYDVAKYNTDNVGLKVGLLSLY